jgi:uncharacterized protein YbjQ (UPF0145 family)
MKPFVFLALLGFLTACVPPMVEVMNVSNVDKAERAAAFEVEIYYLREEHPKAGFIDNITANSCKHMLTDAPSTKGNALEQLRIKAYRLGADAVVNVYCDGHDTDTWGTNCWNSVTCSGDAVKLKKR